MKVLLNFHAMAIVWAAMIGAPAIAIAAGPVDVGKREYDAACAGKVSAV